MTCSSLLWCFCLVEINMIVDMLQCKPVFTVSVFYKPVLKDRRQKAQGRVACQMYKSKLGSHDFSYLFSITNSIINRMAAGLGRPCGSRAVTAVKRHFDRDYKPLFKWEQQNELSIQQCEGSVCLSVWICSAFWENQFSLSDKFVLFWPILPNNIVNAKQTTSWK